MRKINSEIRIPDNKFKITVGTTDKKNPTTIYIGFGGYITPKESQKTYSPQIHKFDVSMKKRAEETVLNGVLSNKKIIFVSEIAEERMSIGKKSYFDIQIYIPLTNNLLIETKKNFKNISDIVVNDYIPILTKDITNLMEENGFSCQKTTN